MRNIKIISIILLSIMSISFINVKPVYADPLGLPRNI